MIRTDERAIAIVGGGFTGTLLALHLLRSSGPGVRILLFERAASFGRGLAYSGANPRHVLNVRVGNMSALPDQPDHLLRWLAVEAPALARPDAFITRGLYGRYVSALLTEAVSTPDGARRLLLAHDDILSVRAADRGFTLATAMGRDIRVDALALATGHLPTEPPGGLDPAALPQGLYAADPWSAASLSGLDPQAPVLMIGTGLTMVDVAATLRAQGHVGPLTALSRRGLLPRRHAGPPAPPGPARLPPASLSNRLHEVRLRAAAVGWRAAVDELRPATQALWRDAGPAERRRFLRHLRPWWDVHRHRMAPEVADGLDEDLRSGALSVVAARLERADAEGRLARVTWRRRDGSVGGGAFARIINCTGPGGDIARSGSPVLTRLAADGLIRPDPLGLGLDAASDARLIDAGGRPVDGLYAAGPLTRGALWEIIAVPDIRWQVRDLALRIVDHVAALADRPIAEPCAA